MKEKYQTLKFDVMMHGRWGATMTMPITLEMVLDYDGDDMLIGSESIQRFVEQRRPSLIGKEYEIWPVTKSVGELFRNK